MNLQNNSAKLVSIILLNATGELQRPKGMILIFYSPIWFCIVKIRLIISSYYSDK